MAHPEMPTIPEKNLKFYIHNCLLEILGQVLEISQHHVKQLFHIKFLMKIKLRISLMVTMVFYICKLYLLYLIDSVISSLPKNP